MEVGAGKDESGLAIALEALGELDGGSGGLANGGGDSGGGGDGEAEGVIGIGGRVVVEGLEEAGGCMRERETHRIGENSVGFGVGRGEGEGVWSSVSHTCARSTHKHFPSIDYLSNTKHRTNHKRFSFNFHLIGFSFNFLFFICFSHVCCTLFHHWTRFIS